VTEAISLVWQREDRLRDDTGRAGSTPRDRIGSAASELAKHMCSPARAFDAGRGIGASTALTAALLVPVCLRKALAATYPLAADEIALACGPSTVMRMPAQCNLVNLHLFGYERPIAVAVVRGQDPLASGDEVRLGSLAALIHLVRLLPDEGEAEFLAPAGFGGRHRGALLAVVYADDRIHCACASARVEDSWELGPGPDLAGLARSDPSLTATEEEMLRWGLGSQLHVCANCGKSGGGVSGAARSLRLLMCGRCSREGGGGGAGAAYYCDVQCQREHWREHKKVLERGELA
jgi:hypothetical protein